MRIVIGEGSCGIAAGAEKVREALLNCDLGDARVSITGCIGMCYLEPIVDIYEDGRLTRLVKVTPDDADAIAEYARTKDISKIEKLIVSAEDNEFLAKQTRIALRRCGIKQLWGVKVVGMSIDYKDRFYRINEETPFKKQITVTRKEDTANE